MWNVILLNREEFFVKFRGTSTSEEDFMFFINGMIMEHDSLNVQQNDYSFLLKVDNNTIGFNLEVDDEFVAFGKFNS